MFENLKIGIGICGSFCSLHKLIEVLDELKQTKADLYLVMSPEVRHTNTRFYEADKLYWRLQTYSDHPIVLNIEEAELFGPKTPLDLFLLMPASANAMAKIAHGICDNAVIMASKATRRNGKPVVIAFYTNDALGNSGVNIAQLINTKGYFFVPFGQDDVIHKPTSMISDHHQVIPTIQKALVGEQLQPMVVTYDEN